MKRVTNADFNPDVYKDYTSYPEPTGRTAKILDFVKDRMPIPKRVLDVGCGKGDGLRILQDYFSDASVFGYEPTICTERPTDKFDLITLFHVFEHVEDLHEMLAYIKSSLAENGHLLIQVPYATMWPFDLVIADHEWHFNIMALRRVLENNGFEIIYNGNDCIKKEITLLAKISDKLIVKESFIREGIIEDLRIQIIDWLLSFKSKLDAITEPVAVYGTSVSAMWTAMILGDKVVCYLDDDLERRGEFNDRQATSAFDCDLPIIAPFPDWQLEGIKQKHPNLRFL